MIASILKTDFSLIEWSSAPSSLGELSIARNHRGFCSIALVQRFDFLLLLKKQFPKTHRIEHSESLKPFLKQIIDYIECPNTPLELALDIQGTSFQKQVFNSLRHIPLGQTVTYKALAQGLGYPSSYRAVAQACASNKLTLAIPCHRVIAHNGHLSGYRWGIEKKRLLLERESVFRSIFI